MGGSLFWWFGLSELIATIRHKLTEGRLEADQSDRRPVLIAFGLILLIDGLSFAVVGPALLRGPLQRELAMVDAARQPGGHLGDGVLAIDADQIGERGEQGRVGKHLRLDAVMQGLLPGVEDISERRLLQGLAFSGGRRWIG